MPCQDWEHAGQWGGGGQENRDVWWRMEGTIIVIYIHTHSHNGWLMGKQAGQGGGKEEGD